MRALANTIRQVESIDIDRVLEQLREEGLPQKRLGSVEEMLRMSFEPTSGGWLIEQGLDTLRALDEQKELLLDRIAKHIVDSRIPAPIIRVLCLVPQGRRKERSPGQDRPTRVSVRNPGP